MERVLEYKSAFGSVASVESKSDAHRALICAALSEGSTEIPVSHLNSDISATAECIASLGARVSYENGVFRVSGKAIGGGELNCHESGSTVRFLLPVAAMLGGQARFTGEGKLPKRPMLPLTDKLREKGADVSSDLLPITVSGKASGGIYEISGDVSSQFVSGLLMALPLTGSGEIRLTSPLQSKLYADMTVRTLKRFGVEWSCFDDGCGRYSLLGGEYKSPKNYAVEGDWSGAAFFVVLGALCGEISVYGLDENSLQPDKAICEAVKNAGAATKFENGVLTVKKRELKPFSISVEQFPDIFPVLAVLACGARGESLLYGAERLRIKESDRIETTASMIRALGGRVETGDGYMKIFGTGALEGGKVDCAGDHRIAMSGAIAACLCKNKVTLCGSEAVNKSYPSFFEVLGKVIKG